MNTINIAVVDDTKVHRDLVRQYLEEDPRFHILGDFDIPSKFTEFIKLSSKNHPDIVLLDIGFNLASSINKKQMQTQQGLEYLSYLMDNYPKMKVIMFSYHNNIKQYVKDAIIKGARGYISKKDGFKFDLKKAILAITRQENAQWFYKSPDIPNDWVDEAQHELRNKSKELSELLTDTQFRVFLGIAKGFSKSKIIASKACTKNAFDAHTSNIRLKLGLEHNWQIPVYSIEHKVKEVITFFEKKDIKIV